MINWKNIRLIRFRDNSYAVRKGWIFYEYFDLYSKCLWWSKDSIHIGDCKTMEYNKAEQRYEDAMGKIEVIK